jgi:hypothetical protein
MRPIIKDMDLATVDVNSVFEDQQLGAAGSFSLDGADVTNGEWISPDGFAHQLSFESAGNIEAATFTITGFADTLKNHAITEDVTAPNATTVESTKYFAVITSIASDEAVASDCECGFVDEAVTDPISLDIKNKTFEVGFFCEVTGTINYKMQHSYDNPQLGGEAMTWIDDPDVANETASQEDSYTTPIRASRAVVNSYSTGAELKITWLQG